MWDDGRNRAVKEALRKNSVQQSVYDSTSRSLDAERRSLESRRVREEGAPRAQHRRSLETRRVREEGAPRAQHRRSLETRRVREEGAPRAQHRRSLETRRVREEGELRAQLRRLQLEQRVHSELDNSGETICTGVTNALMPDSHRPPDKTRRFCPCRVWRCELSRNRQEKSEQLADRSPSSRGV